jgi:Mor family transcriptional regulator
LRLTDCHKSPPRAFTRVSKQTCRIVENFNNYGGFVADFLDDVCDLVKCHVDEPTADKITAEICKMFGGGQIYVRKKTAEKVSTRHAEIKRRFTGNNHTELAREFDLGMSQIYRILQS